MIDGRPKRFGDFADIVPHPKTRGRWLESLAEVAELGIVVTERAGVRWWRMSLRPVPTKVKHDRKVCSKCPEVGVQAVEEFGKNCMSPDGYDWVCRSCRSKQRNEWAANNRDAVNRKQRRNYRKRRDKQLKSEQLESVRLTDYEESRGMVEAAEATASV